MSSGNGHKHVAIVGGGFAGVGAADASPASTARGSR
jgi:NADPH-dependent 2,4-dienoyl-CoA reductase/sulfur reductase-like enzyme